MAKSILQSGGVRFEWFVDRALVTSRVDKKVLKVLSQVGAFGRTVMRRSIRAQKKSKKARTVQIGARQYLVPVVGKVIDLQTGRFASASQATAAREAMRGRLRSEGAGQPPRRGPTDLLRKFILFGVNPDTETVVIGAMPFRKQPRFSGGIVSVPELLEKGGGEYIRGELVQYQPRPFVQPAFATTRNKLADLIEKTPL